MKKYNLSKIMKRAWEFVKKIGLTISEALKKSWKEEKGMDIKEIISRYEIRLGEENMIRVYNVDLFKEDRAEKIVKSKKAEIISYLKNKKEEEQRANEERQKKIKSIDGLEEIEKSFEEQRRWTHKFNCAFDNENGFTGMQARPRDYTKELMKKYPRAAAYIQAHNLSTKTNYELSQIGAEALEKIINGDDYRNAILEMEQRCKEFTKRHIYD